MKDTVCKSPGKTQNTGFQCVSIASYHTVFVPETSAFNKLEHQCFYRQNRNYSASNLSTDFQFNVCINVYACITGRESIETYRQYPEYPIPSSLRSNTDKLLLTYPFKHLKGKDTGSGLSS